MQAIDTGGVKNILLRNIPTDVRAKIFEHKQKLETEKQRTVSVPEAVYSLIRKP